MTERTNPLDIPFIVIGTLILTVLLFNPIFGLGYGFGARADGVAGDEFTAGATAMCLAFAAAAEADMAQARAACPQLARELPR